MEPMNFIPSITSTPSQIIASSAPHKTTLITADERDAIIASIGHAPAAAREIPNAPKLLQDLAHRFSDGCSFVESASSIRCCRIPLRWRDRRAARLRSIVAVG